MHFYRNQPHLPTSVNCFNRILITLSALATCALCGAAHPVEEMPDSVAACDSIPADSVVKPKGLIAKIIDYFGKSNRDTSNRKFDMSIIGGPHYSSDTKFGIGLVAAGFYRTNRTDTVTQPSNLSLYTDVTTSGFYMFGLRGDHIFNNDARRINYNVYFYSFPRKFWGIGYGHGINMDNASKYKELYFDASVDFLWRLQKSLYVGPAIQYAYVNARHRERPELWEGDPRHLSTIGLGFRAQYDTRDNFTAPQRGVLLQLEQRFCPAFLGNTYAFSYTDVRLCGYQSLWRDAVGAARFHGRLAYGTVPWDMLSTFGGSNSMRGYYEGRFRDKGEMDLTFELRQHIWRRNGIVVWFGAGTVFPELSKIQFRQILPNCGIGYRWEFKKLTNVRLDFGLAKGETAFIFSINEAF